MPNTPTLPVRIAPEIVEELTAIAAKRGLTRSELIREALARTIDEASKEPKA